SHITGKFKKRLDRAFDAAGLSSARHCVFLKPLSQGQYVAAIGQCDVVLDTPEWSGGNSTLECLTYDLPIVTLPGALMRSRHSTAILRLMGIEETIARSLDDYVAIAVRLAHDTDWRGALRDRIAANKHRLYRDHACIAALEEFLERAVRA